MKIFKNKNFLTILISVFYLLICLGIDILIVSALIKFIFN